MVSSGNDKYSPTAKAKAIRRIQKKIWKGSKKKTVRQESEVVTTTMLEERKQELSQLKEELSQVKAAKTIEMDGLKEAIQCSEEKEIAKLKLRFLKDIQNEESQGKGMKIRLIVKGTEEPENEVVQEPCAECHQKGHWREWNECEIPEEHLQVPNSDEEFQWIGVMSHSNKESKESRIKQEKTDDDSKDNKGATGREFENFVIKSIRNREGTNELEYEIKFHQEDKAMHIKTRASEKNGISFRNGYCEKVRATNDDKTALCLFIKPIDQNKTFDQGNVGPTLEKILSNKKRPWQKHSGNYHQHWMEKKDNDKAVKKREAEKRESAKQSSARSSQEPADKYVPKNAKEKSKATATKITMRKVELKRRTSYQYGKESVQMKRRSPDQDVNRLTKEKSESVAKTAMPKEQTRLVKAKGSVVTGVATERREISPTIDKADELGNLKESMRQKDLKITQLTRENAKVRGNIGTSEYTYSYSTEDEAWEYTSSEDDRPQPGASSLRVRWTPPPENPSQGVREARDDLSRKQVKKQEQRDHRKLVRSWYAYQPMFEEYKVKPACIHIALEGQKPKRYNLYTRKYEKPERVDYVQDEQSGKAIKIDQCYVATYESNRPRRRTDKRIDSEDCKTLLAAKETKRIFNLKQKKPRMNLILKAYMIIIGMILLTERPHVNLRVLNQKLVY